MTVNSPDEFDQMMGQAFATETIDTTPYGAPAQPVKPGLTKRGKASIAIAAAVIAGGSLLFYQHYSAAQAASEAKSQEIALKQQELKLEELKELNRQATANTKAQSTADANRQKQIDTCVADNKGLVEKQFGITLESVIQACQTQYQTTTNTGDMQTAASSTNTSGGGGNTGLLIGGGVLAVGLAVAVRKSTRSNPA
jgi:hypothetical protein